MFLLDMCGFLPLTSAGNRKLLWSPQAVFIRSASGGKALLVVPMVRPTVGSKSRFRFYIYL